MYHSVLRNASIRALKEQSRIASGSGSFSGHAINYNRKPLTFVEVTLLITDAPRTGRLCLRLGGRRLQPFAGDP